MKKHATAVFNTFGSTEGMYELRARLIYEECCEAMAALGFRHDKHGNVVAFGKRKDDASIVKECADIHVVTTGTQLALGLTAEDVGVVQKIVDENNQLKVDTSPGHDEYGKMLKAKDHPKAEPAIAEYLEGIAEERRSELDAAI